MKTLLLLLLLVSSLAFAQSYTNLSVTGATAPIICPDTNVPTYSGGQLICGAGGGGGGGGVWGAITGTLSNQVDLQTALNGKQASLGYTPLNAALNFSDIGNAATARTNLGLGSAATHPATDFEAQINMTTGSVPFATAGGDLTQNNADFFWDNAAKNLKVNGAKFQTTYTDPFARKALWAYDTNQTLELGSWQSDGMPFNSNAEGIVVYGDEQLTSVPISASHGSYARVKAGRFGLYSVESTLPAYAGGQYWFRVDPTSLYLRDNAGAKNFEVVRATGAVTAASVTLPGGDVQTQLNGKQASLGFTAVPDTRQVNGHALSSDVTVTKGDVGLGSVTNDVQLKAADLDTDGTLAANSDTKIPSQKAVKTYADTKEPTITATTSADYYRGDKTFQNFNNAARAAITASSPLGYAAGNLTLPLTTGNFFLGVGSTATDSTPASAMALLPAYIGDTPTVGGTKGAVPASVAGDAEANKFLKSDATWTVVDQSKPRVDPFKLWNQTTPGGTLKYEDVTIQGNFAYVAGGTTTPTLSIFDIRNQASPYLEGTLNLLGTYHICVSGNYAYVPSSGGSTLYVVDVSNPKSPTPVGSVVVPNAPGSLYGCAVSGNYVYLATQSKGLNVVDVTVKTAPVHVYQEAGAVKSFGIALSGTTLYTTVYQTATPWTNRFFKTWDITAPAAPNLTNTYTLPANTKPNGITLAGTKAYVTDTNQMLVHVLDITTPTAPSFLSSLTPSGVFNSAFVAQASGNYAYVPSGSGAINGGYIDMFDLSTPATPVKIATASTGVANSVFGGIALNNGYIYSADYGVAPGVSSLDVFTMPIENLIAGALTVKAITLPGGTVTPISATAPLVNTSGVLSIPASTNAVDGFLSAADHTTLSAKQDALSTGTGITVATPNLSLTQTHDLWVARQGVDAAGCGQLTNPCATVGYATGLVTAPSSTNNWTIHLASGREDNETGDILLPPYTWLKGEAPDVGSYLRLPAGKAIKLGAGWTSNARGGIQSVYVRTDLTLDFAAIGGAAGSNFAIDDCYVTGNFTHTGRGVNGGDFLYIQNTLFFGTATLTGSELQSVNNTWQGAFSLSTSATVNADTTIIGGLFVGSATFTQTGAGAMTVQSTGAAYNSTFTTVGTMTLTVDDSLPIGYTLSGGTTRVNTKDATAMAYTPTVGGNWSPAPSLVGPALDQLASRISAISSDEAVALKSSAYSVALTDKILIGDATGGTFAFTLPTSASAFSGGKSKIFTFTKKDSSTNAITVAGNGAETIMGSANVGLTKQYQTITVYTDGGGIWYVR